MAELRKSGLISAEECAEIAQEYSPRNYGGEVRLIIIASLKEIDVVKQTVSLLEKRSLSGMSKALKCVLCWWCANNELLQ